MSLHHQRVVVYDKMSSMFTFRCDSGEIESIIKIEPEVMEDFVHEPDDEDTRIIPYMPAKGLMVDHRK